MIYAHVLSLRDIVDKRPLLTAKPDELVRNVACRMPIDKTGAVTVVDEKGTFIGILTERDIVQKAVGVFRNVDETTVDKTMTRHPSHSRTK